MEKENEVVPNEQEVKEAAKQFKVTKAPREPRYMTPEEVKTEAPQVTTHRPVPIEEPGEESESWAPPREPHKPRLEDGKRYNAKITEMEVLKDQPVYNNPDKKQDVLVYTFDLSGVEIKRRVTKSTGQMSNLYKLALEFGYPNIDITGFDGRNLLGKNCRVKVRHSKPTADGSIFDNIDVDSVESVD